MGAVLENVLTSVPAWTVYLLVFVLPFVECSLFVGFVFPGETALVLGGVLASGAVAGSGRVSLVALCVLASLGAVLGDSVGYAVGRRYGAAVQSSRLGRVVGRAALAHRRGVPAPARRARGLLRPLHGAAARAGAERRGDVAPAVPDVPAVERRGRPGLGQRVRRRRLPAGASYHRLERWLGTGALVLTAVVLVALVAVHLVRRRRGHPTMVEEALDLDEDGPTSVPSGR